MFVGSTPTLGTKVIKEDMKVDSSKVTALLDTIESNILKYPWYRQDYYNGEFKYGMNYNPDDATNVQFFIWGRVDKGGWFRKPNRQYLVHFTTFNRVANKHEETYNIESAEMSPEILDRLEAFCNAAHAAWEHQKELKELAKSKQAEDSILRFAAKVK